MAVARLLYNESGGKFSLYVPDILIVKHIIKVNGYHFVEPFYGVINCCETFKSQLRLFEHYERGIKRGIYCLVMEKELDSNQIEKIVLQHSITLDLIGRNGQFTSERKKLVDLIEDAVSVFNRESAGCIPSDRGPVVNR